MKTFLLRNKLIMLSAAVGGLLGYAYYSFIGCKTGTCAITSSPINSSLYGAVMGYLIHGMFTNDKKEKHD